ncbi:hypothetical protein ACHAXT_005307 [Thalassiosira profunda]
MATADTSAFPAPLLEEWPAAKTALPAVDTHLVQDQLSLQRYLAAQQQGHAVGSHGWICEWAPTNIRLPSSEDFQQGIHLCLPVHLSEASYFKQTEEKEECKDDGYCGSTATKLRLMALDRYLSIVAPLARPTEKLLGCKNEQETRRSKYERQHQLPVHQLVTSSLHPLHRLITSTNSGRVVNVLQGEIAHCTPAQADVLVSDDATTCHIVALWSRCVHSDAKGNGLLATMAHIDGPGYEASIRDAVNEHVNYHSTRYYGSEESKESSAGLDSDNGVVEMSVHLVGGFNDRDGSSIEITDSVLRTLSALSHECYAIDGRLPLRMTLENCAVASANDNGSGCPIGRGLAMKVSTGCIFLAEVDDDALSQPKQSTAAVSSQNHVQISAQGPATTLRSTRLWAGAFHDDSSTDGSRLHVIHRPGSDFLCVDPFFYGPHPAAQGLLECDDEELLEFTSTSPNCEKPNFVSKVRESLEFMNGKIPAASVFGERCDHPLMFRRVGLNGWVRSS